MAVLAPGALNLWPGALRASGRGLGCPGAESGWRIAAANNGFKRPVLAACRRGRWNRRGRWLRVEGLVLESSATGISMSAEGASGGYPSHFIKKERRRGKSAGCGAGFLVLFPASALLCCPSAFLSVPWLSYAGLMRRGRAARAQELEHRVGCPEQAKFWG